MNTNIPEIIVRENQITKTFYNLQVNFEVIFPIEQIIEILGNGTQFFSGKKIHLLQKISDNTPYVYVYPVVIKEVVPNKKSVVIIIDYSFNFADVLKFMALDGEVSRRGRDCFSIKWINRHDHSFIWHNTKDGYVPWTPANEDVKANDWGIRFGYKKQMPEQLIQTIV